MTSAQLIAPHRNDNNPCLPTLFAPDAPTAKMTNFSARGIALLGVLVTVLVTPHLKAETSVNYPSGSVPYGIAFDGANIWVVNQSSNTVTKLLASTGAIVGAYPVGSAPSGVAFDGVNIWVANQNGATVTKLLASTGATVGTYAVGSGPSSIAFDGVNIWVTNAVSNSVTKLLASNGATLGTYALLWGPQKVAFDGVNIWVTSPQTNTVRKLLASTGATVGTFAVGSDPSFGVAFDGANVWVTNYLGNSVTKLSASTGATVGTFPVGSAPTGIAFDGTNIWVANLGSGSVTKLLASTGAIVGTFPVGTSPLDVAFDGTNIWVANAGSNNVTKINPAGSTTATLSANSLAFGNQIVGLSSAPQTVTMTNSGTSAINITGIAITGTNSADYAQTNTCGNSVAAGSSCVISVTFTPRATGSRTALVSVADNASSSPQTIGLTGTAQLTLQTITFGPLSNVTYPAPPFTLGATASSGLSVSFAATSPAVCTVSGATVTIIGVGTCAITASQAGNTTYSAAPSVIQSFMVIANQPTATLSLTSLAFGSQVVGLTSAQQSATVTNSGTATLNITGISITGTNSADYAQTNTCGRSVAAGSRCVISVTFTPTTAGTRTGSISVTDNASSSPQTISLTGTGQAPGGGISIVTYPVGSSPVALAFDGVNIWVANLTSNTVTKLVASTGAVVGTYPAGSRPAGLAFDGVNIWVTDNGTNAVTKLLASTGAVVGTYPVGASPWGIVFDGVNIWVQNTADDDVTKLLASTGATVGTYINLPAGSNPSREQAGAGLAFDGTNIWVANGTNTVTKMLASTGTVVGSYPVGPFPAGLVFDGANIWLTNNGSNTVTKLLASTGATLGTYPVGGNPLGIAFDGVNIWVTNTAEASYEINGGVYTVTELLASTGATVGTYTVGSYPSSAMFDGANIWVTNQGSNTVTNISLSQTPPSISPSGVVPLDSTVSTIQPGEWVSIYGSNLASGTTVWNGNFPTSLGGTSVKINGKTAYLSLASPGQINLQAPDDTPTGPVPVVVTTSNGSATSTVTLAQFAPSFALLDTKHVAGIIPRSDGSGAYGGGTYDILGPTGNSLGYSAVAAKAGDTVELFGVGFGPTTLLVAAGKAFSGAAATTNAVQLVIGGTAVTPSFAGLSSAGLYQINVTLPVGLGTGDTPLTASVGGVQTQSSVVISLVGAQPTGFTGYWTFTAQSSVYGFQSGASGQLTQSGNNISGQLSLGGTPCAISAAVSGTVSGSSLSMTLNENGQLVTFSGSVSSDGNSASGTYVAPAGGCTNGDSGTWVGTRK